MRIQLRSKDTSRPFIENVSCVYIIFIERVCFDERFYPGLVQIYDIVSRAPLLLLLLLSSLLLLLLLLQITHGFLCAVAAPDLLCVSDIGEVLLGRLCLLLVSGEVSELVPGFSCEESGSFAGSFLTRSAFNLWVLKQLRKWYRMFCSSSVVRPSRKFSPSFAIYN